jgi:putative transcriptional regulator
METSAIQGKLLIASPRLVDPNFVHTVLLMVQHSDQGSMGLVLNRPLQISVREACHETLGDDCKAEGILHQGGPCQGPLMVLHGDELSKDADVLPGVFFTTEREKIESLLRTPHGRSRYFVGYSGWAPGQLEAELEIESWIVVPAHCDLVFEGEANLWSKLLTLRKMGPGAKLENIPDDPSLN